MHKRKNNLGDNDRGNSGGQAFKISNKEQIIL